MMESKTNKSIPQLFIVFLAVLLWWNFGLAKEGKPDYWPTKVWKTASPESQGVDSKILVDMLDMILKKNLDIDSVLVIRNGYIVMDAYCFPRNSDRKHNIFSCSKSVTSALVGIAIDKGYIKSVDLPILDFFPKRVAKNLDANKKAMTLEHLLTMTAGLKCRDSYRYNWSGLQKMKGSNDWVQFMLNLPMAEAPGTRFEYCNGATFLLSAILQERTGMNALSFAKKHLFGPLGISDITWPSNPQGITLGYGRIYMRPRDMAKIGYLYLNNGVWDGERILSHRWIEASTRTHIPATLMLPGYGYQWWIADHGIYVAVGHQGQYIFVVPEKDMVVVVTSRLSRKDSYIPIILLHSHIISAVRSSTPLPENPKRINKLKSLMTFWQTTTPWDRDKIRKKAEKAFQGSKLEGYVNNEYGFSAKYDAELLSVSSQLVPPVVFRKIGLRGVPIFAVLVDDIPQGMALKDTGKYMIGFYKKILQINDPKVSTQKLVTLSDGTEANYFEIHWRYQALEMVTVCVFAYKNNTMIGAVAAGMGGTPVEYLAGMAKSLKMNTPAAK